MKFTALRKVQLIACFGMLISSSAFSADSMTVVYNHLQGDSKAKLAAEGGLSVFVRFNDQVTLFDAGGEADPLLKNFQELGLDANAIDAIVISHGHWDHIDGLPGLLKTTEKEISVYVPGPAADEIRAQNPGADVVAVDKTTRVGPDAWAVGPMETVYREETLFEQALVLDHDDGLVVIVGCSHPGIVSVAKQVREVFGYKKIKLIAGGFHLRDTPKNEVKEISLRLQQMGVDSLAPTHCTGEGAIKVLRKEWGDRLVSFDLGDTIRF